MAGPGLVYHNASSTQPPRIPTRGGLFKIPTWIGCHLILFGGLVFCWGLFIYYQKSACITQGKWTAVLLIFAYGIIMDLFRKLYPNEV